VVNWLAVTGDLVRDERSAVGRTLEDAVEETLRAHGLHEMAVEIQESRAVAEVEDLLLDAAVCGRCPPPATVAHAATSIASAHAMASATC
jgi:hypothetical protein